MKIHPLYFILLIINFNSCAGKNNNNDTTLTTDILEKECIVLDSLSIMSYSADELIERNGKPFSDMEFSAFYAGRDQRIIFQFYDRDSTIKIRELIWETDSINRITIWYSIKSEIWQPFVFRFWNKWMEF